MTKKEVRSFLRQAKYHRGLFPSFAVVITPLSNLTRTGKIDKVRWEPAQEKDFTNLKRVLN